MEGFLKNQNEYYYKNIWKLILQYAIQYLTLIYLNSKNIQASLLNQQYINKRKFSMNNCNKTNKIVFLLGCLLSITLAQAYDSQSNPETKSMQPFPFQHLPEDVQNLVVDFLDKNELDGLAQSSKQGRSLVSRNTRDGLTLNINSNNIDDAHPESLERATTVKLEVPDISLARIIKRLLTDNAPKTLQQTKSVKVVWQDPSRDLVREIMNLINQTALPNIETLFLGTSPQSNTFQIINGIAQGTYSQSISLYFYYDTEENGSTRFEIDCFYGNSLTDNRTGFLESLLINRVTALQFNDALTVSAILKLNELELPSLQNLDLSIDGDTELQTFLDSGLTLKRYKIGLSIYGISSIGAQMLSKASSTALYSLKFHNLDDLNLNLILPSLNTSKMETLWLWSTPISNATFQKIIDLGNRSNFESLRFDGCELTDNNIKLLMESPFIRKLLCLEISGSNSNNTLENITSDGIQYMANSSDLSQLNSLVLNYINLNDTGLFWIMNSQNLRNVESLSLHGNLLTDTAADIIIAAPIFEALSVFQFGANNQLSQQAYNKIRAHYPILEW